MLCTNSRFRERCPNQHVRVCKVCSQASMPTANARADTAKVHENFNFRVLRQNRRVISDESRRDELETFHCVLADISMCRPTEAVKQFLIAAYVRGASTGSADRAPLEGQTAVFTKRRYRDQWNRCITRKVAKTHNHSIKIKAKAAWATLNNCFLRHCSPARVAAAQKGSC